MGLIGCVAVLQVHRGWEMATRWFTYVTGDLSRTGANFAFVGCTYSGMERLYGKCEYKISSYYFMGKKNCRGKWTKGCPQ